MALTNTESKMPLNHQDSFRSGSDTVSPTTDSTVPLEFRNSTLTSGGNGGETQIYKKRYFVLLMFILLSGSNSMQWIEYSIIAHIISHYYSVPFTTVDWCSMIYMLSYMILVFPGSKFDQIITNRAKRQK
uniref:Uncharacterized protein n=1 Tax=Panagrolaimus sp. ES5 TaxID=591445 RepID=A0AC34G666_9BILA